MGIEKELKVSGRKGYCCPMDSGPMNQYIRKTKKRIRKILKRLTRKEVQDHFNEKI